MPVYPRRSAAGRMDKFNKITVPAGEKLRKLQKIVHDIKKNDSGIMSKFKKLTSKPPPSVPPVDYDPEHGEEEQWSDDFDSDYENPDDHSDSEMYVVPTEENCDDSYEPPPSEQEKKKIPAAFSFPTGEYIDNQHHQQQSRPIGKPLPTLPTQSSSKPKKLPALPTPSAALKPKLPPKPKECTDDEADYVVPVDDEEDNYIEPTEESSSQPIEAPEVNRDKKPTLKSDHPSSSVFPSIPVSPSMHDVYEIPEEEEKPSPPLTRISKPLPPKPVQRPGRPSHVHSTANEPFKQDMPRNILPLPRNRAPPKIEADGFDTRDDESHSSDGSQEFRLPSITAPSPFPRITRKHIPAVPSKPSLPDRDHLNTNEDKPIPAERRRGSSQDLPLPPIPSGVQKPLPQRQPISIRSPEPVNRTVGTVCNSIQSGSSTPEQDASVHGKAWYVPSSDRKTAEDALYKSNKDGSFLVRKSSGQDSKQPYTLVVFYNNRVYNIPIRFIQSTRQYALGREKSGEERFNSVTEIIENHQRHSLVLIDSQNNTKDSTKLKYITRVS